MRRKIELPKALHFHKWRELPKWFRKLQVLGFFVEFLDSCSQFPKPVYHLLSADVLLDCCHQILGLEGRRNGEKYQTANAQAQSKV